MDNIPELAIYGVSIVALASTIVGIVEYYQPLVSDKIKNTLLAILCVIGFVSSQYLPSLPWVDSALSTLITSILIFGSMIGVGVVLRKKTIKALRK